MRIGDAVKAAAARLAAAGVETPALDARVLAAEAFAMTQAGLLAGAASQASAAGRARLEAAVERRVAGEPTARILGRREFWGLDFALSPETLVPRPDSETLVEAALEAVRGRDRPLRLLDLGTGSGCLLLALLSELPGAWGLGVDRSPAAAATARANAASLGLEHRAAFMVGDWAAALGGRFDLVVSNPPYVATPDLAGLSREVRLHDPARALDGGADGLAAYRDVLRALPALLAGTGAAVLELGAGQRADVEAIARAEGLSPMGGREDLSGVCRALIICPQAPCER